MRPNAFCKSTWNRAGSGTRETCSIGRGHSNIPDTVGVKVNNNNKNRDIGVGIIRSGRAAYTALAVYLEGRKKLSGRSGA